MTYKTNCKVFKIGIYAHPSAPISSVAGVWDIFNLVKQLASNTREIQLALIGGKHFSQADGAPISLYPSTSPDSADYDLIIIAALGPIAKDGMSFDPQLLSWVKRCSNNGAAIASICTGAFLLASTGLLDKRKATTHWKMASVFKTQFPEVELRVENMLTHDGTFFCSGGAYAFQDLCLYLVDHFFGRGLAQACSELLMIDLNTRSQLTFSGLQALKVHNDKRILMVQNWLEDKLGENLSIEEVAKHFSMSSRNLVRRFKSATNEVPSNYIQKLRVEKAKSLLQSKHETIESIAYQVGYQDIQYFRQLFKKTSGMTPSQFRQSLNLNEN